MVAWYRSEGRPWKRQISDMELGCRIGSFSGQRDGGVMLQVEAAVTSPNGRVHDSSRGSPFVDLET